MKTYQLGGPRAKRRREDTVREGAFCFQSPRGLAKASRLLVEALPKKQAVTRALFGLDSEAAVAFVGRELWPEAVVQWFHLDAYVGHKVAGVLDHNDVTGIEVVVAEDLPEGPFDLIALPFPASGEALLMLDLLEAAHDRLAVGGRLVAATDGKPAALRDALKKVFGKFTPAADRGLKGACFYAERKREAPRSSDRSHVLTPTFKLPGDVEQTLQIETRPGTFSHGRVDRGTRTLVEWIDVRDARSVVDLGAGCGAIGLSIAARSPDVTVLMVESNARAVGCARRNAERNGLGDGRVRVLLRSDAEELPRPPGDGYDLVVANPPYFAHFRIARSFIQTAHDQLHVGGRIALVVKAVSEHLEHVRAVFGNGGTHRVGDYGVVTATRKA